MSYTQEDLENLYKAGKLLSQIFKKIIPQIKPGKKAGINNNQRSIKFEPKIETKYVYQPIFNRSSCTHTHTCIHTVCHPHTCPHVCDLCSTRQ